MQEKTIESHPLEPFLPGNAKLLMLGSFPPPRAKWSMDFYYPNMQNDMWRIFGLVFFNEKDHFLSPETGKFDRERIEAFLTQKGIALYDTAEQVVRHKGNASDKFLEVVRPTDIEGMLRYIPECSAIVATGQKATDVICSVFNISAPATGWYSGFLFEGRDMKFYRMPSSSRAYPKPLAGKAGVYKGMFEVLGMME